MVELFKLKITLLPVDHLNLLKDSIDMKLLPLATN